MNENELPNMDTPVNADTSMKRLDIEVNGQKLWIDFEEFNKRRKWLEEKEKEYWRYHFSGQRTIDMFGVEGAKKVLERQHRNDMKMIFNHRSRGKK